ncbi:hypothetical protein KCP73_23820 [Salmonella enterica subsp. enterica]|nr:hypothetical protein KCP73_23820 [Salmonella enterica subsp. enterica]
MEKITITGKQTTTVSGHSVIWIISSPAIWYPDGTCDGMVNDQFAGTTRSGRRIPRLFDVPAALTQHRPACRWSLSSSAASR